MAVAALTSIALCCTHSRISDVCLKTSYGEQACCVWCVHVRALRYTWLASVALVCHDAARLCTGSEDQKVYLWDLQTKEIAQTLIGHTGAVLAVSTHPTEMIVASGGMAPDNTVKIWKDLSLDDGAAAEESSHAAAAAK